MRKITCKLIFTSRMGIIMAVVAALLIHMERKAVTHMKPSMMEVIASPDSIRALRASLLCKPEQWSLFKTNEIDELISRQFIQFV